MKTQSITDFTPPSLHPRPGQTSTNITLKQYFLRKPGSHASGHACWPGSGTPPSTTQMGPWMSAFSATRTLPDPTLSTFLDEHVGILEFLRPFTDLQKPSTTWLTAIGTASSSKLNTHLQSVSFCHKFVVTCFDNKKINHADDVHFALKFFVAVQQVVMKIWQYHIALQIHNVLLI